MTELEIVEVEPGTELLGSVIALGNGPSKRTLGHLPDEAFEDRARKGTLLAALGGTGVLGYVLYDLPGYHVKIVHLCVGESARRRGAARALIDGVASRHSDRERIVLSCRQDYDANAVWAALDFIPVASKPGRSKVGHLLTVWVRDFGHPTLFDIDEERACAALDHNVFLDLHIPSAERRDGRQSRYLMDDWIGEYVELCVTDEIFLELQRLPDPGQRSIEQRWAQQYRKVSSPGDIWEALVESVAQAAPRAGAADHRHVARAAAAGAAYFVSRDGDLLTASQDIEAELGIVVLQPEGLISRLDQMRADDPYKPVALQGTELRQRSPSDDLHEDVIGSLLNHAAGEKRGEMGSRLRPVLADPRNHEIQVIQDRDEKVIGAFVRRQAGDHLEVPFIRVAPGAVGAHVVARHLVSGQRKRAADRNLVEVRVTDPHVSRDVRQALASEHFEHAAFGWRCEVRTGIIAADEVPVVQPVSAGDAFEFEDRCWPAKVAGAGIPTFLVPIKVAYAEALFDTGLADQSLLPRELALGLGREHVYYRKPSNSRGIATGARILWYVTGDAAIHSRGSVRAVSHVMDTVIGRPRTVFARFERLGVYTLEKVLESADGNGKVMAIRFANTELFERPTGLDDLERLWEENGDVFRAPLSPTPISERMFCLLYERSSLYAH